jgi:hypothetical protein
MMEDKSIEVMNSDQMQIRQSPKHETEIRNANPKDPIAGHTSLCRWAPFNPEQRANLSLHRSDRYVGTFLNGVI